MIASPHLSLTKTNERWSFQYHTPEALLPQVKSKDDLKTTLNWYAHPFIKLRVGDSPEARRRYVEKIRPALRWFCTRYGENIPNWLQGNNGLDEVPKEEFEKNFGPGPFKVREFEELKTPNKGGGDASPK